MFGPEHYVPIVKGKKGEYDALRDLFGPAKDGLTPLLEVPPIPWDFVDDAPTSSLDQHVSKSVRMLTDSWDADRRIFVDVLCGTDGETTVSGNHALEELFSQLRAESFHAVPVTGPARSTEYQDAVRDVHREDERGVCLRLTEDDVEDAGALTASVDEVLDELGATPDQVDLVVDLGGLAGQRPHIMSLVASTTLGSLPYVNDWRSLTFAFAAFPESVADHVSTGSQGSIPRWDAAAWRRLTASASRLPRVPTFGDYGADNPSYVELDMRVITPAAHIRYTIDEEWLIFRGRVLYGSGSPGFEQFHDLADIVVSNRAFRGGAFSTGDRYIEDCAARRTGPGNLTTWRTVATNHHLTLVTHRLASHGVP